MAREITLLIRGDRLAASFEALFQAHGYRCARYDPDAFSDRHHVVGDTVVIISTRRLLQDLRLARQLDRAGADEIVILEAPAQKLPKGRYLRLDAETSATLTVLKQPVSADDVLKTLGHVSAD